MRDLTVPKERIDYSERHLQVSHRARTRERHPYGYVDADSGPFRSAGNGNSAVSRRTAELTQANDDLTMLVDRLIGTMEGSIQTSSAQTVPKIAKFADDLLQSEPQGGAVPCPARSFAGN